MNYYPPYGGLNPYQQVPYPQQFAPIQLQQDPTRVAQAPAPERQLRQFVPPQAAPQRNPPSINPIIQELLPLTNRTAEFFNKINLDPNIRHVSVLSEPLQMSPDKGKLFIGGFLTRMGQPPPGHVSFATAKDLLLWCHLLGIELETQDLEEEHIKARQYLEAHAICCKTSILYPANTTHVEWIQRYWQSFLRLFTMDTYVASIENRLDQIGIGIANQDMNLTEPGDDGQYPAMAVDQDQYPKPIRIMQVMQFAHDRANIPLEVFRLIADVAAEIFEDDMVLIQKVGFMTMIISIFGKGSKTTNYLRKMNTNLIKELNISEVNITQRQIQVIWDTYLSTHLDTDNLGPILAVYKAAAGQSMWIELTMRRIVGSHMSSVKFICTAISSNPGFPWRIIMSGEGNGEYGEGSPEMVAHKRLVMDWKECDPQTRGPEPLPPVPFITAAISPMLNALHKEWTIFMDQVSKLKADPFIGYKETGVGPKIANLTHLSRKLLELANGNDQIDHYGGFNHNVSHQRQINEWVRRYVEAGRLQEILPSVKDDILEPSIVTAFSNVSSHEAAF